MLYRSQLCEIMRQCNFLKILLLVSQIRSFPACLGHFVRTQFNGTEAWDWELLYFGSDNKLNLIPLTLSVIEMIVTPFFLVKSKNLKSTTQMFLMRMLSIVSLKVPKCEIFDLFDFNDFYAVKCQ